MAKNIVLCIDGTWNAAEDAASQQDTNVHKLAQAALDQTGQLVEQIDGIGTDRVLRIPRKLHIPNLIGGLTGFGMSSRIKRAYKYLSANYSIGDNIYLFGFSRGAFAARSLAGFVDAVGLLLKNEVENSNLIEIAYALYENDGDPQHSGFKQHLRNLGFPSQPSREDGTFLPIYFIGVWDTVGALGLPDRLKIFSAPFTEFHQTALPSNISYARHALAIHELRKSFPPLLWEDARHTVANPGDPPVLQQMWFAGAHADVGGGYPETGWSAITLDWMATQAASLGLKLKGLPLPSTSALSNEAVHNSRSGVFAVLPIEIRRPVFESSTVGTQTGPTFDVHETVIQRLFDIAQPAYAFSDRVDDTMLAADWLSIAMIEALNLLKRGDADAARLQHQLCGSAGDASACVTGLVDFAKSAEPVIATDTRLMLRAFMLSHAVCGRARAVLDEVCDHLRATLTDDRAFDHAAARFESVARLLRETLARNSVSDASILAFAKEIDALAGNLVTTARQIQLGRLTSKKFTLSLDPAKVRDGRVSSPEKTDKPPEL